MTTSLITGTAGFIGSHLAETLLNIGHTVIGIDNFNDYYDPQLKHQNNTILTKHPNYTFIKGDIRNSETINTLFKTHSIDIVIHLAAMAGVRYSIENPTLYFDVNINGTLTLLEACRHHNIKKLLFASSSSVYGNNQKVPFSESDTVDFPVSPYAASKKAGELICYNYHHLFNMNITCIRFFTVYGPRQRPEMAIHKFTRMIDQNETIPVFNNGNCLRDYTYIDDIIQGIQKIMDSNFTYDIVNLGESAITSTLDMIRIIESSLGKKAILNLLPPQPGDVDQTYANISHAKETYGYSPQVSLQDGINRFIKWYTTTSPQYIPLKPRYR
jgi:UDP-glucuronate 4-epimerase